MYVYELIDIFIPENWGYCEIISPAASTYATAVDPSKTIGGWIFILHFSIFVCASGIFMDIQLWSHVDQVD